VLNADGKVLLATPDQQLVEDAVDALGTGDALSFVRPERKTIIKSH